MSVNEDHYNAKLHDVILSLTYSSLFGRVDISLIYVFNLIRSEVSTFPIAVIYLVAVYERWLLYHNILPVVSYRSRISYFVNYYGLDNATETRFQTKCLIVFAFHADCL